MTRDPPTTAQLARALEVDPDDLDAFVSAHPDPAPAHIAAFARVDLDDLDADVLAAYLDARDADSGGVTIDDDLSPLAAAILRGAGADGDEDDENADISEFLADGGRYRLPDRGARVRDREADGEELIVVDVHPETAAADHTIDALDATVAEVNDCDPAAPVVDAVYVAAIDGWRTDEDLREAVATGAIEAYTFPVDRLGWSE